ncbi:ankyrin repeat-containing domain protein [Daldinia decipiens]|uniref:ankyrin repeat-containing domain protein n=1 Tax=Daldinia decipiens TaxID=326647 RepID=UPI0020C2AB1E|nr:ankyrin repeat-containing domain protein [Daldinia decipiens]KAI1659747.1 ankyrin repeat-containing domain protein [Daldinia decipiens]
MTLLDTAVSTGNREMAQLLLDAGADVDARGKTGFLDRNTSPLHVACRLGLIDMVRLLLNAGADVNLPITNGITALHTASMRGFASICKLPLTERGALIVTDALHQTPLHIATRLHHIGPRYKKTAVTLIEALQNQFSGYREGSNRDSSDDAQNLSKIINAQIDYNKRTALMYAAITGDVNLVIFMIDIGASIHITDEDDRDALFGATIMDDVDMVRCLLDNGAQLDRMRGDGSLLLHDACACGSQEVIEEFLKRNTPVDHLDNDMTPPIGVAATCGLIRAVKQLIPRSSKEMISLALIFVARYGCHEIVNTLVETGANINHQDEFGNTPPQFSCWNSCPKYNSILLYDPLLDSSSGIYVLTLMTPKNYIFHAAEAGNECFKILLEHGAQAVLPESIKRPPQHYIFKAGVSFLGGLAYTCSPNIIRAYVEYLKLQVSGDAFLLEINEALAAVTYVSKLENIEVLLECGADPNFMTTKFDIAYGSAIGMAVLDGDLEIWHFWNSSKRNLPGVSRDIADDLGRLPPHLAALWCPTNTRIDFLTTESSTFRSTDKQGRNALHHAATGGRSTMIERILKECPDLINVSDRDGWTPLHWSCRQDDIQATESLINHGANREAITHHRWAPRHVAIYHGKTEHLDFFPEDGGDTDDEELPSEAAELVVYSGCNSCFCEIYGTGYRCGTCPGYWLCFKCYWIHEETHPRHHVFSRRDQDSNELDTPPSDELEATNGQDGENN